MKFLVDQDVYESTVKFLVELQHDVVRVSDINLSQATDQTILQTACEQNRIVVTRDRDYGALVFVKKLGAGVLYLRMKPSSQNEIHNELKRITAAYSQDELSNSFVVIDKNRYRKRRIR